MNIELAKDFTGRLKLPDGTICFYKDGVLRIRVFYG